MEVIESLRERVAEQPACLLPSGDRGGHRLGEAYLALGDSTRALNVWQRTVVASASDDGPLDALLGDYVERIAQSGRSGQRYAASVQAALLAPSRGDGEERYRRVLDQLATVVPDSVREAAFRGRPGSREITRPGAVSLRRWWASQDPFPASDANERWVEHLLRVGIALDEYGDASRRTGYDDRGTLLVRFGAPALLRELSFTDPALVFAMSRANVGLSVSSFPPGEVWVYQDIDQTMWYLLVARGGQFAFGRTEDLLPSSLRNATGQGRRQESLRQIALLAMRYVYDQLATLSLEHGQAWSDVVSALDRTSSPFANAGVPNRIQRRLGVREAEWEQRRAGKEPASRSLVRQDTPPAPFAASASRFPTGDGRTRLELTWQLRADLIASRGLPHVLVGTVVSDPGSEDRVRLVDAPQPVTVANLDAGYVPTVTAAVVCPGDACPLSVQFDLYAVSPSDSTDRALIGVSVWDVPPLPPLAATGLVLSDLQPVDPIRNEPRATVEIRPGTPLGVYFEAVGFETVQGEGALGRSRVFIEYEVVRRRSGGLLRRSVEIPSSDDLRLFVRGDRTEQYLNLDTSDWDGSDEVEVTVRVRDEQTRATAERSRTFAVRR